VARLVISPLAQHDLDKIWDYTCDHWDWRQADRYTESIKTACGDLAAGLRRGRSCDDIRTGYCRLAVGSHIIFYKQDTGIIDVKRILYQSMDFQRHL
jgi:toxin ParE1/3/4